MDMYSDEQVTSLFRACDTHNRGFLEPADLERACPQLRSDELHYIFTQLDVNADGRVSEQEFRNGFLHVVAASEQHGFPTLQRRVSLLSTAPPEIVYGLDMETPISCHDDILTLYENIQGLGVPVLLKQFEKVIGTVLKEVKEQKEQNERLHKVYKKEKDRYSKQMNEVESELGMQIAEVESRVRQQERERMEREKEDMRSQMESEIAELQSNVRRLQKLETVITEGGEKAQQLHEIKQRVHEIASENRSLRSSLVDAQTTAAVVKAQLVQMRHEFEDKCNDLVAEKETLILAAQERENLTKQLELLCNANQKLHDTNDALRCALESRQAFCKRYNLRSPSPVSQCSGLSDHSRQDSISSTGSSHSVKRNVTSIGQLNVPSLSWQQKGPLQLSQESFNSNDDADSGLVRDSEVSNSASGDEDSAWLHKTPLESVSSSWTVTDTGGEESSFSDLEVLPVRSTVGESARSAFLLSISRKFSTPNPEVDLPAPAGRDAVPTTKHRSVSSVAKPIVEMKHLTQQSFEATGPPEHTFRVVMAGDSAVGKSSFLVRLCKGKFISNMPSTLGVDFHVRTLNVDSKNVAIQLWDTAGQERFRSLCKSYFRRADGVLLMYDCTCEQSFLSVRSWIDTIKESSQKQLPVLLCGNKTDSRVQATTEGKRCISADEGRKLAQTHHALFLEASAKDGTNVIQAAVELARELLTSENCEVRSTSLLLQQPNESRTCTKTCNKS